MTNFIHAGALTAVTEGRCSWRWSFEDVFLRCDDTVLPGELECATHFIEAAQQRELRDRPFSAEWRRFPATPYPQNNERSSE